MPSVVDVFEEKKHCRCDPRHTHATPPPPEPVLSRRDNKMPTTKNKYSIPSSNAGERVSACSCQAASQTWFVQLGHRSMYQQVITLSRAAAYFVYIASSIIWCYRLVTTGRKPQARGTSIESCRPRRRRQRPPCKCPTPQAFLRSRDCRALAFQVTHSSFKVPLQGSALFCSNRQSDSVDSCDPQPTSWSV